MAATGARPTVAGRFPVRWVAVVLVVLALLFVIGESVTVIGPRDIGLKFSKAGSVRGISNVAVVSGYVLFNPLTTEIIRYPRGLQNYTWTRASAEGDAADESFTFNSSDQVKLNGDVNFGYELQGVQAPVIYVRYGPDIERITHGYIHSVVRDAITRTASQFTADQMLGQGRARFEDTSAAEVKRVLEPQGFLIRNFSFIGEIRPPQAIANAITAKIEAQQQAVQAQNKIVQSQAEAQQAVARARGEAQAILVRAQAQAQANKIIAASLTPELVQAKQIEKWNGALPQYAGGGGVGFLVQPSPARALPAGKSP